VNIATIDIVFGSLILILVVRCALRGFIEEFMSMAALVLGLLCAILFFKPGAEYVRSKLGDQYLPELVAFVGLFLIAFVLVKILERILKDIMEQVKLGGVDRLLGVLLGLVEGLLVVSAALFVLSKQPLFDSSALLDNSFFAKLLLPLVGEAGRSAAAAVKGA
jgi:membrane protein required for colicin V production